MYFSKNSARDIFLENKKNMKRHSSNSVYVCGNCHDNRGLLEVELGLNVRGEHGIAKSNGVHVISMADERAETGKKALHLIGKQRERSPLDMYEYAP